MKIIRKFKFKRVGHVKNHGTWCEYSDSAFIGIANEICEKLHIEFVDFKSYFDECTLKIKCDRKTYSQFIVQFAAETGDYVSIG